MDDGEYVLNRNPQGIDVLHARAGEKCNLDDSQGRTKVDPETGEALVRIGSARWCAHCGPKDYTAAAPTLNTRSDLP